jgi:hypothetical protein
MRATTEDERWPETPGELETKNGYGVKLSWALTTRHWNMVSYLGIPETTHDML